MAGWRAPVTRWALMLWVPENDAQLPATALVAEQRVQACRDKGWHLLGTDTEIETAGVGDDERGEALAGA